MSRAAQHAIAEAITNTLRAVSLDIAAKRTLDPVNAALLLSSARTARVKSRGALDRIEWSKERV